MSRVMMGVLLCLLMWCAITTATARAAMPSKIQAAVFKAYPPAVPHRALETAYEELDPSKLRGYVVLERGGIPAEQARRFISWAEYDYRAAVINLEKEGKLTTRRGRPYTYLKPGDVMAVAGIKFYGRTVYLKLISPKPYMRISEKPEKRFSRVTVMVGMKFPKQVIKADDVSEVLQGLEQYLKPFQTLEAATAYAQGMHRLEAAEKPVQQATTKTSELPPAAGVAKDAEQREEQRMKALEQKIDAAQQQIDKAQEELRQMRKE